MSQTTPPRAAHTFPAYTPGERTADAILHAVGLVGAGVGCFWLLAVRACCLSGAELASVSIYSGALSGTLLASALYNLARPGRRKELLRRVDHAMIYALIAGTYTPFAVAHMREGGASLLVVWGVAFAGMVLKLAFPRRHERAGFALYLGLGWSMAVLAPSLWALLRAPSVALLAAGGVLYTLGSAVHLMDSRAYHNVAWHAFVLVAAACHFMAVVLETAP